MSVKQKTKIGTIDCTPAWSSLVPILIELLANGSDIGKQGAREELYRMAGAADKYVALQKDREDLFKKVEVV